MPARAYSQFPPQPVLICLTAHVVFAATLNPNPPMQPTAHAQPAAQSFANNHVSSPSNAGTRPHRTKTRVQPAAHIKPHSNLVQPAA